MLAKDIMTRDVITVSEDDTVEYAIQILKDKAISGLPVVDASEKIVGVVSEGDLIYKSKKIHFPLYFSILDSYIFLEDPKIVKEQMLKMAAYKVKTLMTSDAITAREDESVENIATLMSEKQVNRIPIVDEHDRVVGIVTRRDIIENYRK